MAESRLTTRLDAHLATHQVTTHYVDMVELADSDGDIDPDVPIPNLCAECQPHIGEIDPCSDVSHCEICGQAIQPGSRLFP